MQPQQRRKVGRFFGVVFSLLFVAVSVWLFLNRQWVLDYVTVLSNQPGSSIVDAADRASLTDEGKFLLYASLPQVQDKATFKDSCTHVGEKTAVLGCYSKRRIYVLSVADKRLDGIEEVTLAHEMLHAAYDRLPEAERANVNRMVEEQFKANGSERLRDLVDIYAETEPGERDNELHSILATEVEVLSPELETYYKTYFKDRQKTVSLFKQYHSVFEQIKGQQQALVDELNALAVSINDQITAYNADAEQLAEDIRAFNRSADSYSSQAAFDRDRQALVARQASLRQTRSEIAGAISAYDVKKKELDALNVQAAELNQSINSRIDEAPSL